MGQFVAFSPVLAWSAFTALCVPDGSAWACVFKSRVTITINYFSLWNSIAIATASNIVPIETHWAFKWIAKAFALLGVPVVGIVVASLWPAVPVAGEDVEGSA